MKWNQNVLIIPFQNSQIFASVIFLAAHPDLQNNTLFHENAFPYSGLLSIRLVFLISNALLSAYKIFVLIRVCNESTGQLCATILLQNIRILINEPQTGGKLVCYKRNLLALFIPIHELASSIADYAQLKPTSLLLIKN